MSNRDTILIVEDVDGEFRTLYHFLTNRGYSCEPTINEYSSFREHLRNKYMSNVTQTTQAANEFFESLFKDKDYETIILDIRLLPYEGDTSGLRFLEFLRKHFKRNPILMLTSYDQKRVEDGFTRIGSIANYYLYKEHESGYLSEGFFNHELLPVIKMLQFWYTFGSSINDIKKLLEGETERIFEYIDLKHGILDATLDQVICTGNELKDYAKITLRMVQINLRKNDKKAAEVADKLIMEFDLAIDFPYLSKDRLTFLEQLKTLKPEIIDIIKEGGKGKAKQELMEYLEKMIKEFAGVESSESMTKALAILICRAVGNAYKFWKTGST